MFTKKEALLEIIQTQDEYVREIKRLVENPDLSVSSLKEINFTSPTGTGKTIMLAKLINLIPDYFFVVTTLSKGQLRVQIANKLAQLVNGNNYLVFGLNEYTKATNLQREEIESRIDGGVLLGDTKVLPTRSQLHNNHQFSFNLRRGYPESK